MTRIVRLTRRAGNLGREHDFLARATMLREPGADSALGRTLGLRTRRHRVHLGGIDQGDAVLECIVDLLVRFALAVLLAPGHGAETDQADLDVGVA